MPARRRTAGTRTASPEFATAISSICFALALWNGRDPILKERLFGLTGNEGNHGEDVKEYYYYLDSTPTHTYMKYLYKYPQAEFPYARTGGRKPPARAEPPEFELIDTGVFNDDRYFDVLVEYAKAVARRYPGANPVTNRGPERGATAPAADGVVPQYVVVGEEAWISHDCRRRTAPGSGLLEPDLAGYDFTMERQPQLLFTENETNTEPSRRWRDHGQPFCEGRLPRRVVHGQEKAVNPAQRGTKAVPDTVSIWRPAKPKPSGCG